MQELINYIKNMSSNMNLKYCVINYNSYISHRVIKDKTHYVELCLWYQDFEPSIHYRNGESGGGGFKATKENIYSYLKLLGCVLQYKQLTMF